MRANWLLSVSLFLSVVCNVFGYDWGTNPGDGTAENPYQISTPEHLMSIGSNPNLLDKHFILINDIVFDPQSNPACIFDTAMIAPDQDLKTEYFQGTTFSGSFDGAGYSITNLTIKSLYGQDYLGLFGTVSNAKIQNVKLQNVTIIADGNAFGGSDCVGGLAGNVESGTIRNCYVAISVVSEWSSPSCFGGLVGRNFGYIHNCHTAGSIAYCWEYVGGLVGANGNTIRNSSSTVDIIGGLQRCGGLVGINLDTNPLIENCYAKGVVSARGWDNGGLVGRNYGTIRNCFAWGRVTGHGMIGGLVGYSLGLSQTIENCYATGFITAKSSNGGLTVSASLPIHSFWDIETSGTMNGYGAIGKTTDEMKIRSTFIDAGWDFVGEMANGTEDMWFIREGMEYPRFVWEDNVAVADAGVDQVVYAWVDGNATVTLDGTGSSDADGDTLEYFWYNDANDLIASGAEPNVVLGVGEHVITLVVSDGIVESELDEVVITVIAAQQGALKVVPVTINRKSHMPDIMAMLELPEEVDGLEDIRLYPGEVGCRMQKVLVGKNKTTLCVWFDKRAVMAANPVDGLTELTVVGKQASGPYVYGKDTVKIIK